MEFKEIARESPISKRGRSRDIEDIRELVAKNEKGIKIAEYGNVKRVSIYRNTIKVAVVEVGKDLSDKYIREEIKKEILKGTFDKAITVTYTEIYGARAKQRREKKLRVD